MTICPLFTNLSSDKFVYPPMAKSIKHLCHSCIEDSVGSLERFKGMTYEEFYSNSDHFRIAFYDLHRALEAVMDIGAHKRNLKKSCKV